MMSAPSQPKPCRPAEEARVPVPRRDGVAAACLCAFLGLAGAIPPAAAGEPPELIAGAPTTDETADDGSVMPARLLDPDFPDAIPIGTIPHVADRLADGSSTSPGGSTGLDLRITAFLGALLAAVMLLKWSGRKPAQRPPTDVFAVLGEAPLGGQHTARIIRFGSKTILVGVSGTTCTPLAEIDDPSATEAIVASCLPPHLAGAGPQTRIGLPLRARLVPRMFLGIAVALVPALPTASVRGDELPAATLSGQPEAAPNADGRPTAEIAALPSWTDFSTQALGSRSVDGILSAVILFGVASIAPAILLMTTSFVRMSVVLSLVRQGLGTQGLPSNQIVTSLALFLSLLVMWPVWATAYREGVQPYQEGRLDMNTAFERGSIPVRRWMAGQIERAGNRQTMLLFLARHPSAPREVRSYDDVPLETLLPAFLVSELKTAFSIGVRLLLPFLVLDLLVATLLASTGLGMVSPATVSLPLKLVVFVMADGWSLVVQSLLDGVRAAA